MNKHVVIVAGGSGSRMNSKTPKQFLLLKGKPILMHTISAFYNFDQGINIVLVLPKNHLESWKRLCTKHQFEIKHELAIGGKERFDSVKNGLRFIQTDGVVGIHDGVRPLVDKKTLVKLFRLAEETGNATPIQQLKDSIRRVSNQGSVAEKRADFRAVQTPQCFHISVIKEAFDQPFLDSFTDDASVAEANGVKINLVEGNPENIKITSPQDIIIAEAFLNHS